MPLGGTCARRARNRGACGAANAANKVTLVPGWTVNANHTGLYVAETLGYFDEVGLDVAIEAPPSTGVESLVLSGRQLY